MFAMSAELEEAKRSYLDASVVDRKGGGHSTGVRWWILFTVWGRGTSPIPEPRMMQHFEWTKVLLLFSFMIMMCFVVGLIAGQTLAVFLFPLSGIFMSVIYPTFNSKGISCFEKRQHGSVAGVILFFTAAGAAAGPFIMGVVSDACCGI